MSRRVAAVLVLVVAAACAVIAAPASAATLPQLTSISVSANQITAPGQVTVSYTATSDTPITAATSAWVSPDKIIHRVPLTAGFSGSGTLAAPDGVGNGAWTLKSVYLNTSGSSATESRICPLSSTDSWCTAHMDFSAATVTVSGSTPDYNAPLISSVSMPTTAVKPGDPVTISWVDDEVHTDAHVRFSFKNFDPKAQSDTVDIWSPPGADLSKRQITVPLKPFAYNGTYQLMSIDIADNLGNEVAYVPGGTTQLYGGAVSPTSHTLDFSAMTLDVTGSTQGLYPPQLTSLHVTPPTAPGFSEPIRIDYTISDSTAAPDRPEITYIAPDGAAVSARVWYPPLPSPPTVLESLYVDHHFGTYRLSEITLRDERGSILTYRRDGTTYNPFTGVVGTHTLNFAKFDVTMVPTAPKLLAVWPGRNSLSVRWSTDPAEVAAGVSQTEIMVNPGGYVIPVANTGQATQQYTLGGLVNGVTYSVSLVNVGPVNVGSAPTHASVTPMAMTDRIFSPGDTNRDGRDDLEAFSPAEDGAIWLYQRSASSYGPRSLAGPSGPAPLRLTAAGHGYFTVNANGSLNVQVIVGDSYWNQTLGRGWDGMRFLTGGFDFTGDGTPDLYATSQSGDLYLYPVATVGASLVVTRQHIGSGWNTMQSVFTTGDFNGDHKADLMAVDSAGILWLYRGNGHGSFQPRVEVGSGWGGFGAVFNLGDFSGNGHNDIGAVDMSGNLWRYGVTGTGGFRGRTLIGTGWNRYF